MVVINTTTGKVYENLNKSQVASLVGVCRQTVTQWERGRSRKQVREWLVYLHAQKKLNIIAGKR